MAFIVSRFPFPIVALAGRNVSSNTLFDVLTVIKRRHTYRPMPQDSRMEKAGEKIGNDEGRDWEGRNKGRGRREEGV